MPLNQMRAGSSPLVGCQKTRLRMGEVGNGSGRIMSGRERAVRDFAPEVIWELLAECYTEVRSTTTAQLSLEALADRKNA